MLQDSPPLQSKIIPQPKWMTILRIILGFILIWKGVSFFKDSSLLSDMIRDGGVDMFSNNTKIFTTIVTYLHLLSGFFIIVGLFTRWVCLLQMPVLIMAVVYAFNKTGMHWTNVELFLAAITLVLLVVFFIRGSGTLSADEYFRSYTKAGMEKGHTTKLFQ